jgi:uncharacterized protein (TIGR00251 family)
MPTRPLSIRSCKEGIRFAVAVQPRASKNAVVGLHNNTLKIRLTSPPVEGAANRTCVKFLAEFLDISPARITIAAGETSRVKTIQVAAMSEKDFLAKLESSISGLDAKDRA